MNVTGITMRISMLSLAVVLAIAGATSALAAGSETDFKAAYAAAEAANKEAGALRNQWTTTAVALTAAKKAADAAPAITSAKANEGMDIRMLGLALFMAATPDPKPAVRC